MLQYDLFCMADSIYYDSLSQLPSHREFDQCRSAAPHGWRRVTDGEWTAFMAPTPLPEQGWKIHLSGCLENSERIITAASEYCIQHKISFKFLRSQASVLARNSKSAPRGGSGKLVTIYPSDTEQCEVICRDLNETLRGEPGPYILSDLRYENGPAYLRYGGFYPKYCTGAHGEQVPAYLNGNGELVPDTREAFFSLPPWVTLPEFLKRHLAARETLTLEHLPYEITSALNFSNGGGVYLAADRQSGETLVLKEARPYAGLSGDGRDAVARLRHERDVLQKLAGIRAVPQMRGYFKVGDHEFLAMEYIDGNSLNKEFRWRFPLIDGIPRPEKMDSYRAWVISITAQVEEAVGEIHRRDIICGDLHPLNILIRPDGRIALIDFEVACDATLPDRPTLGNPGFTAPADRYGFEIDAYSLACLRLSLFMPLMTSLIPIDQGKAAHLADIVAVEFGLPYEWLDKAVQTLTPKRKWHGAAAELDLSVLSWPQLRDRLASAIIASATPHRDDRLFPGDPAQFTTGGLDLAHGAAGVLWALHETGVEVDQQHVRWLADRAATLTSFTRPGLYDGLHGIAYALHQLGQTDRAMEVLDVVMSRDWGDPGDSLLSGLSGIGLSCLHFAAVTGEPRFIDAAAAAADAVIHRLGAVGDVAETSGGTMPYAGLIHGGAGKALFLIRAYEAGGDTSLLDCARTALLQDLRRCVIRDSGQMQVNEGWRTLPYLATGSAGIGLVIHEYLTHRYDGELASAVPAIKAATQSAFYIQSGLFDGRAGMLLHAKPGEPAAEDHIRRLSWHACRPRNNTSISFPGNQLLRMSMDLATGTAGILLAAGAAHLTPSISLPFLTTTTQRKEVNHHDAPRSPEAPGS
ncbi:class III lanthionine synthetase LanKC [Streptomyces vinaceus]